MVKYECNLCNYLTKNKSDLTKHLKTKKHLEILTKKTNNISDKLLPPIHLSYTSHTNSSSIVTPLIKNQLQCDYCERIFTRYDNLGRHIKSCEAKRKCNEDNELKKQLQELRLQVELLKTKSNYTEDKNKHITKEKDHYKDEATYYKNMLMEAGGLVKKSVSALTYSIKNYDDAPTIKTIEVDKIDSFKNPNKQMMEDILSMYKHKTLNKHLGDAILKIYKKDTPGDQSIWNTDDTRLTYLVKELLSNKSSNWIVDKKGIKTMGYLITPLLTYIKTLTILYQENYGIPEPHQINVELDMILENNKKIIELVNDIDDGVLSKDILKYISTHLRFNDNSLKE